MLNMNAVNFMRLQFVPDLSGENKRIAIFSGLWIYLSANDL
jgi:hypothetical protein